MALYTRVANHGGNVLMMPTIFYFFRLIVFFNKYIGSQHNVGVNVCIRHNQMMYGKSGDEWAIISLITQQSQVRMNKKYMDLNS